jgi:hypothetical protein
MCKKCDSPKLLKYDSFINESLEFLLEGKLNASDLFLKRLLSISKSNKIANILYTEFSKNTLIDKNLTQNFVDITDKEDTVTFISDRNADQSKGDIYKSKSRNEVRIGRLARYILNELGHKFKDSEIEVFVNTYKASKDESIDRFKLISGVDIKKYYIETNYASDRGTLGDSCMRYDSCVDYFRIYTKNPEQCQLLVYLDDKGKVLGRALVWKISSFELFNIEDQSPIDFEISTFMDRVYTSSDSDVIKFTNYAKSNGWLYKNTMSADETESLVFRFDGKKIFGRISVILTRGHFSKYPFVDTLSFYDSDKTISNVGFVQNLENDDDISKIFGSTSGETEMCDVCDGTGKLEDSGDECSKCSGEGKVNCGVCAGSGNTRCSGCFGTRTEECRDCAGEGAIDCETCHGSSVIHCTSCRNGNIECLDCKGTGHKSTCEVCKGDGEIICPECQGVPETCKECKGEGCDECDDTGTKICDTCSDSIYVRGGGFKRKNKGKIDCDCDGGFIKCSTCDGDGSRECEKCEGIGHTDCEDCSYGRNDCEDCNGTGENGECKVCKGVGHLGPCKNPACDDGEEKCTKCNGTGERDKSKGIDLCTGCSGILDDFKIELKNGLKVR